MPPAGGRDASLYFLILLILSVCLSWAATAIQRQGLYRVLKGEIQKLPDVFSLRLAANALVVGALTFFFGLALKGWAEADVVIHPLAGPPRPTCGPLSLFWPRPYSGYRP